MKTLLETPANAALHDMLELRDRFGDGFAHVHFENNDTSTVMAHIDALPADAYVCLIDGHTLVRDAWSTPNVAADVAIIGAPVQTALGKRLGYTVVTKAGESRLQRLRPTIMPAIDVREPYAAVDFPNFGALILRVSTLRNLGGLRLDLSVAAAVAEYSIRVVEAGLRCVSDTRVTLLCEAGYADYTQNDDEKFRALRTAEAWQAQFGVKVPTDLALELICTGSGKYAAAIIHRAGVHIARIHWAAQSAPPEITTPFVRNVDAVGAVQTMITRARATMCAIVDTDQPDIPAEWLKTLVCAGLERVDIAAVALGSDGEARVCAEIDATATLLISERIPVHCVPTEARTAAELLRALSRNFVGNGIGCVQTAHAIVRPTPLARRTFTAPGPSVKAPAALVSVVVMSCGVNDINELSTGRLRANTRDPYDISVVVRRNDHDIATRLRSDSSIRVFVDSSESAGAQQYACALADAGGEYIAFLRDDIIVPDSWLMPLLDAFVRIPQAGIVAPRISNGVGSQAVEGERFANTGEFNLAAGRRRKDSARRATLVASVSQPAFLIRRSVLQQIGGIDTSLGLGEYAMLDLSIRVQAAGHRIVIAEDALLHNIHGDMLPKAAAAPVATDQGAMRAFIRKWQLGREGVLRMNISEIIRSPLALAQLFQPLAIPTRSAQTTTAPKIADRPVFLLPIESSQSWQRAARLIKKYQKTFTVDDAVILALGCMTDVDLETAAGRVERIVRELDIRLDRCADVYVCDGTDRDAWLAQIGNGPRLLLVPDAELRDVQQVTDLSPSGLRQSLVAVGGA